MNGQGPRWPKLTTAGMERKKLVVKTWRVVPMGTRTVLLDRLVCVSCPLAFPAKYGRRSWKHAKDQRESWEAG